MPRIKHPVLATITFDEGRTIRIAYDDVKTLEDEFNRVRNEAIAEGRKLEAAEDASSHYTDADATKAPPLPIGADVDSFKPRALGSKRPPKFERICASCGNRQTSPECQAICYSPGNQCRHCRTKPATTGVQLCDGCYNKAIP